VRIFVPFVQSSSSSRNRAAASSSASGSARPVAARRGSLAPRWVRGHRCGSVVTRSAQGSAAPRSEWARPWRSDGSSASEPGRGRPSWGARSGSWGWRRATRRWRLCRRGDARRLAGSLLAARIEFPALAAARELLAQHLALALESLVLPLERLPRRPRVALRCIGVATASEIRACT
jgi:hypothetical protein